MSFQNYGFPDTRKTWYVSTFSIFITYILNIRLHITTSFIKLVIVKI